MTTPPLVSIETRPISRSRACASSPAITSTRLDLDEPRRVPVSEIGDDNRARPLEQHLRPIASAQAGLLADLADDAIDPTDGKPTTRLGT